MADIKMLAFRKDVMESKIGMTSDDKLILSSMLNINYNTGGTVEVSEQYFSRKWGMSEKTVKDSINHLYQGGVLKSVEYVGNNRKGEKVFSYKFNPTINKLFNGCLDTE